MPAIGKSKHETAKVNYEQLGRSVEAALVTDYIDLLHSTRRQVWSSFIRGIFGGLGGVIGATVGVALLVALLHQLGGAPFIGHYLENTAHTIQSTPRPK